VPKKRVAPAYPEEARRAGLAGMVWLKCRIGADGLVKETKVMKADAAAFVDPASAAAKQWMFVPAQLNGKPIEVWAAIPFRFGPER
jgi:TonB family protein